MSYKKLCLIVIAFGVIAFVLCGRYTGPLESGVHSYGSNVTFSFIAYFLFRLSKLWRVQFKLYSALYALLIVTASEFAQKFGFYSGVYDPLDLIYNFLGIVFAVALDTVIGNRASAGLNA
jgi:hypothetical protein